MGNNKSKPKTEKKEEVKMTPETYDFAKVDPSKRIIGVDIVEVLKREGIEKTKAVPLAIQVLLEAVEKKFETPKILKQEGQKTETNIVTYKVDNGEFKTVEDTDSFDIHVLASVLKKYARELPGGMIPYDPFAALGDITDQDELVAKLKEAIPQKLNETQEYFLYRMIKLHVLVMSAKDKNEMELAYLTQAFRMNLMPSPTDPSAAMKFTTQAKLVCDALIGRFDEIFDKSKFE